MPELVVTLQRGQEQMDVPFVIMTVPAVTQQSGSPNYGQWNCISPYLGHTAAGKYLIAHPAGNACPAPGYYEPVRKVPVGPSGGLRTVGGQWHSCNPSAYFFDNYVETTPSGMTIIYDDPFLVLNDFTSVVGWSADGEILRQNMPGIQSSIRWKVKGRAA